MTFDEKNWIRLIVIDTGNKIFKTSKKLYPINKKVGVPKSNKPIPKIDWKKIKKTIIRISKKTIFIKKY